MAIVNNMQDLLVECPVCHASNPPGYLACFKCATLILDPAERAATIVKPASEPSNQEATIGGTTGWSVPIQKVGPRDPNAQLEPGTVLGEPYEISNAWRGLSSPGS